MKSLLKNRGGCWGGVCGVLGGAEGGLSIPWVGWCTHSRLCSVSLPLESKKNKYVCVYLCVFVSEYLLLFLYVTEDLLNLLFQKFCTIKSSVPFEMFFVPFFYQLIVNGESWALRIKD